jgi:hypothetical protein
MAAAGQPVWEATGQAAAWARAMAWPGVAAAEQEPVPPPAVVAGSEPVRPLVAVAESPTVVRPALAAWEVPALVVLASVAMELAAAGVRLAEVKAALEAEPPASAAWRGPAGSMVWPSSPGSAASGQSSDRSRTTWSPPRGAAAVPAALAHGSSRARERRSRYGSAARSGRRDGSATAGGEASVPPAHPSAAVPSAACQGPYRCLSRKTPCSPNRLASRVKRRHGNVRPASLAASHRSTT